MSHNVTPPRPPRRRNSTSPEVILLDEMEDDSSTDPNYMPGSAGSTSKSGKLSIMSPIMKKDKDKQEPSKSPKFVLSSSTNSVRERSGSFKSQRLGGKHLNVSKGEQKVKTTAAVVEDEEMEEIEYEEARVEEPEEQQPIAEVDEEVKTEAVKDDDDSEIEDAKTMSESHSFETNNTESKKYGVHYSFFLCSSGRGSFSKPITY